MKIVVAPNAFKESLTALEAANFIEEGIKRVFPECEVVKVPMADGGDGTAAALVGATGGRILAEEVNGPLGEKVKADYGLLGDGETAVVEMAAASGLRLIPSKKRNPLITTTYGTGELIKACLGQGAKKVIVGIGGSATVDGGAGMAQALGARLLDRDGKQIPFGGGGLGQLDHIDVSGMDERINQIECLVASDVDNPLTGPSGAAAVYGPQKGATQEEVVQLDRNLSHYADVIRRDLGINVKDVPGAGAAGGLGAGLLAFFGAQLKSGIEIVIQASGLKEKLQGADLIITGEGKIDSQTAHGKAVAGVAKLAKRERVPVVAVGGSLTEDARAVHPIGVDALFSTIPRPVSLDRAMERAGPFLADAVEEIMRLWVCCRKS
ncbi:glycerate kinase [candidate division KSB1 bacterium]|nr:glycerate kinase [candidate division KSB1 bacterium]